MKSKQQGFTLVELIVVIVILGILAATALPKFIDMSSDARTGVLKGVEASMRSANSMVYGKAAANGQLGDSGSVLVNGVSRTTVCGYVAASDMNNLLDLNPTTDFDTTTAGTVKMAKAPTPNSCQVVYSTAAAISGTTCTGSQPTYTPTTSGC